jgi:hypothetical protein
MNYTWRACVGVPTRAPRFLRFRSCAGQITQQGAELPDPKRGRRLIQPAAEVPVLYAVAPIKLNARVSFADGNHGAPGAGV